MKEIKIDAIAEGQRQSWLSLLEVAQKIPNGWTLIGGQLVQLHCWERNLAPHRVTNDIDTVLNILSEPEILERFTEILKDLGFEPETHSEGHQLKWKKGEAEIDVLFPNGVGERALKKTGIFGGTTIETPGGRKVLEFSEKIIVSMDGMRVKINRPHLLGSIFIKSAAVQNVNDADPERHLNDLAVLASLFTSGDVITELDKKSKSIINSAIGKLNINSVILSNVEGAKEGVQRLISAIEE